MAAAVLSGEKRRSRSEGESDRADSEHASSPAPSSRSSAKHQIRHRASIACASCRERRIRCVVGEGESECAQCRRTGATCIIKDDDERRRPISKAYMSSLSNRINLLEDMLKERGVAPPPAVHPPKTRQEAQSRHQHEQHHGQAGSETSSSSEPHLAPPPLNPPPTPPGSGDEDVIMVEQEQPKNLSSASHAALNRLIDPLLLQEAEPKKETSTRHLLCTRGSYVFDQGAGRTRYFGPTANSHVHTKTTFSFGPSERLDQAHRVELVIGSLAPSTQDHLMRCFSEHYNSWQRVVDESAFEAGRATQDSRFYSPFLHLAMLGIGYRFSDWDREDMKAITLGNRESTLHREAKAMVEVELEQPGGIASVQALLMLADLECGVGRDTTGWMYSGMANRLAFDIGLHVNPSADVSELERQTRCQAMAACVMFDRKWALLVGRPIAIKMQDVRVDMLPRVSGKPLADSGISAVATHSAINRQMFELLELAGKVADFQNSTYGAAHLFPTKAAEDRAYLHFIGLERLFHNWYRRLPENLTWKPVNIKSSHMGFFMLHQQFHVCMILLHRPWAKYGPMSLDGADAARYPSPASPGQEDGSSLPSWMAPLQHHDNRASMSRSMCTQHAIRIARIFWHLRQRFDGRKVVVTAIQHAGTAALALMAALAHKSAELDHHSNLRYLQVLSSAIYDMSHLYQPAARMYQLLKTMLVEIRSEMVKSGGFDVSTLVGRYQGSSSSNMVFGSNHWAGGADMTRPPPDRLESIQEEDRATKRRRLSSLSSMDVSCLTPSFLTNMHQTCPTPPGSSQSHDISNPAALEKPAPEASTFDMDFFHSSFVDFINSGGEGTGSQDWTASSNDNSEPIFIPSVSGDISCVSSGVANQDTQPTATTTPPPTTTTPPPTTTTPTTTTTTTTDDETSADKTIEDWLAEPSKSAAPTTPDNNTHHQQQRPPAKPPAEYPAPPTTSSTDANLIPSHTHTHTQPPRRGTLTHATADGTPVCRDPYVLSLETELGIGFGLGPDPAPVSGSSVAGHGGGGGEGDSITCAAGDGGGGGGAAGCGGEGGGGGGAAGCGGGGGMDMDPMDAIEAIDWFAAASTASPAATQSSQPQQHAAQSGSGSGGAGAGMSPVGGEVPVTPVTLDELVLSVEEAVGSARARARARAAASGCGSRSGGGGDGGSGSGSGSGGSPVVRNRELDFLVL